MVEVEKLAILAAVIQGLDLDGDGKVDSIEVIE